jgi:two-component system OmpR family response regulator
MTGDGHLFLVRESKTPAPLTKSKPAAPTATGALMGDRAHLLIVDEDPEIRSLMVRFMESHGFAVTAVPDAAAAKRAWISGRFQLVVLDLMIRGESGFDLFRWFRAEDNVPVVMVTANADEGDRIAGLELGADDYIAKPFNPHELLARILAILRRTTESPFAMGRDKRMVRALRFAGWTVEPSRRRLLDEQGVEVPLSGGEYDLLSALMEQPNRVMTRDRLLDLLHGRAAGPVDRAIDMAVSRLRRKLNDNGPEKHIIKTVRCGGYVFVAPVERG